MSCSKLTQGQSLPWNEVEKKIFEEMNWLRNNIETFHKEEIGTPVTCTDCLLRKIAILIVSGKVKTREIKKAKKLKSFWSTLNLNKKSDGPSMHHGQDWHKELKKQIPSSHLFIPLKALKRPNLPPLLFVHITHQ